MPRFNHMELTLPPGELAARRPEIRDFFADIFGFDSLDVPIVGQTGLLLRTDPETSQFILVTEQQKSLQSPGYDHLGFLYDTRAEVDVLLEKVQEVPAAGFARADQGVRGPGDGSRHRARLLREVPAADLVRRAVDRLVVDCSEEAVAVLGVASPQVLISARLRLAARGGSSRYCASRSPPPLAATRSLRSLHRDRRD